jgi:required for meiotic nuclear division protein 1
MAYFPPFRVETYLCYLEFRPHRQRMAGCRHSVEPWARRLAETGRSPGGQRKMIRLIGSALLVQHRVAERVAVREKPDILWDRTDLERLYSRLEDEYELVERAENLARKLDLIGETVTVLTDMIDAKRSLRLEGIIVGLILAEIGLTLFQMGWR